MFKFLWENMSHVFCNNITFIEILQMLAHRQESELAGWFLSDTATKALFENMSYAYKAEFIHQILYIKEDILNELAGKTVNKHHISGLSDLSNSS